jgi:Ras-related protein Rab-1A
MQDKKIPIFKVVMIGDSGVGKSSLLLRYTENQFTERHNATIGVDFKTQMMEVKENTIKLQIWDTAGQERFRNITSSYYRFCHCFILVFDTTNKESFINLDYWYNETQKYKANEALYVIIGTKKDLKDNRKVPIEQIKKFISDKSVDNKNIRYFETSAKMNDGIDYIFDYIADILIEGNLNINMEKEVIKEKVIVDRGYGDNNYLKMGDKKSGCCK